MRAVYYKDLPEEIGSLSLEGEEARHLIKVVRIRESEEILLMNGAGRIAKGTVSQVEKREVQVEIQEVNFHERGDEIHLCLGLPKRDAFEDILRSSVELGIAKIYFWKSEYSQHDYKENDRYQRILESALIQSNNPYFPELISLNNEEEALGVMAGYEKGIYFCSHAVQPKKDEFKGVSPLLMIIGPEGGFSQREEQLFENSQGIIPIHLPTPILRASTAVPAALGYMLGLKL